MKYMAQFSIAVVVIFLVVCLAGEKHSVQVTLVPKSENGKYLGKVKIALKESGFKGDVGSPVSLLLVFRVHDPVTQFVPGVPFEYYYAVYASASGKLFGLLFMVLGEKLALGSYKPSSFPLPSMDTTPKNVRKMRAVESLLRARKYNEARAGLLTVLKSLGHLKISL